ncbi:MAG: hypothetical protein ACRDPR_02390, partial [Nocardioidaceae bacterium]
MARTYVQSDAYGGAMTGGWNLPEVGDLIMVGVPNRGAAKAWNILHDDWNGELAFQLVLSKVVAEAYDRITDTGNDGYTGVIQGPDYDIRQTCPVPAGTCRSFSNLEEFISLYIPTARGLLATYPFLDSGSGFQTVNTTTSGPGARNAFVLDLNAGLDVDYTLAQLDASPNHCVTVGSVCRNPNAFVDLLTGDAVIVYGDGVETPVNVKQHTGPGTLENGQPSGSELLSFPDFIASVPGASDVWYEELHSPDGDSTVPTVSSTGQFASDEARIASGKIRLHKMTTDMLDWSRPTTLQGILTKGDNVDHTSLMSLTAAQRTILVELGLVEGVDFATGIPPEPNDISYGLWLNPIESLNRAIYFGVLNLPDLAFLNALESFEISSAAVSGSGGTSNAAVSGSVIVDVITVNTQAAIGDGARINQGGGTGPTQAVVVTANDDTTVKNIAGAVAVTTGAAGVGVGLVVTVLTKDVRASIGAGSAVAAADDISVRSTSTEDVFEIAASAGVSTSTAGVGGSVIVDVISVGSRAYVESDTTSPSTVEAGGDLTIAAGDEADIALYAGGASFGSSAGVGVASTILVKTTTVRGFVGGDDGADTAASDAVIGSGGTTGVTVSADQDEDIDLLAVGGGGSGTAGVAGSVVVNTTTQLTRAYLGGGTKVNATAPYGTHGGVAVSADDDTSIFSLAGALAIGGTAGVGAGVDVEVVTKDTQAWIGDDAVLGTATSPLTGNVTVDATSTEDILSIS